MIEVFSFFPNQDQQMRLLSLLHATVDVLFFFPENEVLSGLDFILPVSPMLANESSVGKRVREEGTCDSGLGRNPVQLRTTEGTLLAPVHWR